MANSYILLADLKAELRYCGCQATEVLGGKKLNKGSMWLKKVTKENHLFLLLKLHTKLTTPIVKLFTVFSVIALFSTIGQRKPPQNLPTPSQLRLCFLHFWFWRGTEQQQFPIVWRPWRPANRPMKKPQGETASHDADDQLQTPERVKKKKKAWGALSLSLWGLKDCLSKYLWTIVISSTFIYFWESFCVWVWLLKLNNFY